MWPSVFFYIFNLCSIDHSHTAMCVAAFFVLLFLFLLHAYPHITTCKQMKTCPHFSLSTNKFFYVKIIVLFVFDFWFPLLHVNLCLPFPPSYQPIISSFQYHHILSLLSSVVPFPLLRLAVLSTQFAVRLIAPLNGIKLSGFQEMFISKTVMPFELKSILAK